MKRSNNHMYLSFFKSALRIIACWFLFFGNFIGASSFFFVAEVFGILEEL